MIYILDTILTFSSISPIAPAQLLSVCEQPIAVSLPNDWAFFNESGEPMIQWPIHEVSHLLQSWINQSLEWINDSMKLWNSGNSGKTMKDLSDFHLNKSSVVIWWGYNLLKCVNRLKCQSGSELDALQGILGGELSQHIFQCCFILKSIVIIPSSEHWILLLLPTRFVSFECRSLLCTNWLMSWKICGGGRWRATLSNLC